MSGKSQRLEQSVLRLAGDPRSEIADGRIPGFESLPVFEEETIPTQPNTIVKTVLDDRSLPGEQFRLLGARVRALGMDKRLRRIGIVSAAAGEGKTTVSLGLARALTLNRQQRVLLIELDLRRPAIDRALGLAPPSVGLLEYLQGASDTLVVRRPAEGGFWLLSAGSGALEKPDLLASPRLASLLTAVDRAFDYVVIDCPPLQAVADAVMVQDLLDGFVFVVRSGHSARETIQHAISLLKPGAIVGFLFNGRKNILPSYQEYAYHRYDQKV